MKKTISTLTQIVNEAKDTNDAAFSISEKFPQLSVSSAEGVVKDVNDFIEGTINESKLGLYLVEAGVTPETA